jgi:hypothetical protein
LILAVIILTRWPELERRAVDDDATLALDPAQGDVVPGAVVHPLLGGPHLQRTLPEVHVQVEMSAQDLEGEEVRLGSCGLRG